MPAQMSASSPHLEARVLSLEEKHAALRDDVTVLTEMYHRFSSTGNLKKGEHSVAGVCFESKDIKQSQEQASKLRQDLEKLSNVMSAGTKKFDHLASNTNGNVSLPQPTANDDSANCSRISSHHIEGQDMNSTQQHFITSSNNRLATDGPVDNPATVPAPMLTPPTSPSKTARQDSPVEKKLALWKPHFITTLQPLAIKTEIPEAGQIVTFHPQFLKELLGGTDWSPGQWFIPGTATCILKNRTYLMLDSATEPYLPEKPCEHGAKLTAFFNKAPEEVFGDLPDGATSYENVPMFVEKNGRYVYYGNYSQTRWSDKLDYDTMVTRIPQHVKEFWATELSSPVRQDWVTEELKNHFFKKPEYAGHVFAVSEADDITITCVEEVKFNERMTKDVRKYVDQLRVWEREAKMKTAMIKKQTILDAFDTADADDPPALRLWWEYLECVDWRKDFYDLLVTLQSREAGRFLK